MIDRLGHVNPSDESDSIGDQPTPGEDLKELVRQIEFATIVYTTALEDSKRFPDALHVKTALNDARERLEKLYALRDAETLKAVEEANRIDKSKLH